ncbi:MAG: DNA/RNA nuclease SfsA [Nannocystaceae bacterium]|nr:DNA/RNA nuclease SfsA [Nannocystaceae bacterium]
MPDAIAGTLLGRRKRFFVDVQAGAARLVAHCPNTGRLTGCATVGARVVLARRDGAHRALRWTWILVRHGRAWVAVESATAPRLVQAAIAAGRVPALAGFTQVHRELELPRVDRHATVQHRCDLTLAPGDREAARALLRRRADAPRSAWIEVKATTWRIDAPGPVRRWACFPDAPTERGVRQLAALVEVVRRGQRAAVVFAVMRGDVDAFALADVIDPAYAAALRRAVAAGVEVYALAARIRVGRGRDGSPRPHIVLDRVLPVQLQRGPTITP